MPAAQAVKGINVFELDGNATTGAHSGLPDDWDRVCHQVLNADCSTTVNTTGATGVSFVSEPNRSTSIFTGGGSKDDLDITGWAWKDQGGLPDKDNLRDGFAARYTCVTASGCTGTAGNSLLYFGADRFDNSGDAAIGLWFLQGDVSNLSDGTFGPDAHTAGDILILSDFTKGGGLPTIRVFAWDPTCSSGCNPATDLIDGTLLPLGGGLTSPADCPSQPANDPFCAVVNGGPGNTLSPWTFTDKSKNTAFAPGEFYEGGIKLTQLGEMFPGLAGECFASFSAETRTSQSTDAVLKDFIIGAFQPCQASPPSNLGPERLWHRQRHRNLDLDGHADVHVVRAPDLRSRRGSRTVGTGAKACQQLDHRYGIDRQRRHRDWHRLGNGGRLVAG